MERASIDYQKQLKNEKGTYGKLMLLLTLILIVGALVGLAAGRADLSVTETARIVLGKVWPSYDISNIEEYKVAIVWDIRLPRILIAIFVGAGLAVSGSIFQAILRNPLADPYTIGVSTGAAFGGSLAIYLNLFIVREILPVPIFAFVGAMVTLQLVLKISNVGGVRTKSNLILSGIIISSILSAGISFLKAISGEEVAAIIYLLMGNLSSKSWGDVLLAFPFIAFSMLFASKMALQLDVMSLGKEEAENLGIDYEKVSMMYLVMASIITAICVSVGGIIGFVGLIVPHLIRMVFTSKNQYLIPLSAVLGAVLLLIADTASRVMLQMELPVGILTTLLGGPFFIYIYMNRNKEGGGLI